MHTVRQVRSIRMGLLSSLIVVGMLAAMSSFAEHNKHHSKPFSGVKVNGGSVTHSKQGNQSILTLSDDFKVPDTPAPHWQVVDTKGNVYLLQRLVIKGDKFNKMITVPSYVRDIAKVQIWCAFAETLLGETTFDKPLT